ncbi:MAG: hypothetical protein ACI35Q_09320 [Marinilabiliaceae bacterium]
MKATSFDQLRSCSEAMAAMNSVDLLKSLAAEKSLMDHFYLTGYEGLCLSLGHRELTQSVISSAVPMYGELLAVGSKDEIGFWASICDSLHIGMTAIETTGAEATEAIAKVLKGNAAISHVLCTSAYGQDAIRRMSEVAHKRHCSVIVDDSASHVDMASIEDAGIDFSISTAETENPISVIIAKRSRLVMTEGNARRGEHDIYAVWQDTLANRNPTWVPMA